ncbi:MAG: 5-(carboxyamino)imidazole ribonucleotide synthase [Xanthomonadales bacterium]|nr:5-(carboxyamino)imidazole ribonucleotide synthase [Xanthomonadales bacterium]
MHIGVLGGGQLSRMMALAGYPLGLQFTVLDPSPAVCASQVAEHVQADYTDQAALDDLAQRCDVITWDFENVPAESVAYLEAKCPVYPAREALALGQDRWHEKSLFRELNIATPKFAMVDTRPDLLAALDDIGLPAVLKTRRMGYDGKGQVVLRTQEDLEPAWQQLGGQALILEQFVSFDFECSVIGVRSRKGEVAFYPIARNRHHRGVLSISAVPARLPEALSQQAQAWLQELLERFDYVGVLTLELFVRGSELLVNEMAPRVHNSGHWSQNGAVTSQFENHLRAVAGLPLGSCDARGASIMLNWIGEMPKVQAFMSIPGLHWHDYGKSARPGRKVGHANLVADDLAQLRERAQALQPLVTAEQWLHIQECLGAEV